MNMQKGQWGRMKTGHTTPWSALSKQAKKIQNIEYNGASLNKKFLSGTNLTQPTNWGVDEIHRRGSGIHIRYRSNVLSGLDSSRAEKLGEISMIKEWNI